jgi:hypothetical protein
VSTLTRLIQRSDVVAQDAVEYECEYEYRDAEYEQVLQARPEQGREPERPTTRDVKSKSFDGRPVTAIRSTRPSRRTPSFVATRVVWLSA